MLYVEKSLFISLKLLHSVALDWRPSSYGHCLKNWLDLLELLTLLGDILHRLHELLLMEIILFVLELLLLQMHLILLNAAECYGYLIISSTI